MLNYKINIHSSIRIENGEILYFDPFKIEKKSSDADFIFITHDHYDHFDKKSIFNVLNDKTKIICPDVFKQKIIMELGIDDNKIVNLNANEKIKLTDDIFVESFRSYNISKPFHTYEYGMLGYIVDFKNEKICIPGDTDDTEEMKNINCDILFIPIGGTYTMDYKIASDITNIISPKIVIPMHYGDIVGEKNLGEKFAKLINKNIKVEIIIK